MEVRILYLDVDDEITTAAARVRASEGTRVGMVLPYGSRLATSRINFRLLARDATLNGKRLAIVASDAATRALAASAGLPIFASVAEYEAANDAERAARGSGSEPEPASAAPDVAAAGAGAAVAGAAPSSVRSRSRRKPRAAPTTDDTSATDVDRSSTGVAAVAGGGRVSGAVRTRRIESPGTLGSRSTPVP